MKVKLSTAVAGHIYREFERENNYFVWEEIPGWVQAVDSNIVSFRFVKDEHGIYAQGEFNSEEDYTAFLLRWA
jgi:hypothetical protein